MAVYNASGGLTGEEKKIVKALLAKKWRKLMDQGVVRGFDMWKRVAAAINELDRPAPKDGEARH